MNSNLSMEALSCLPTTTAESIRLAHLELQSETGRVRRLKSADRERVIAHLEALDSGDRNLRFGSTPSNSWLREYVAGINFGSDILIGVFHQGELVGVSHLAVFNDKGQPTGEIGVSVDSSQRGQHFGSRLMDSTMGAAAAESITKIYMHFLQRNRRMRDLCRRLAAPVESDGRDCTAKVQLA